MREQYNDFFKNEMLPGTIHLMAENKFVGMARITQFDVPVSVLITMSCVIDRLTIASNTRIGNFIKMDIGDCVTISPDVVVQKGQRVEVTVKYITLPF
jgi:hypothetical protein